MRRIASASRPRRQRTSASTPARSRRAGPVTSTAATASARSRSAGHPGPRSAARARGPAGVGAPRGTATSLRASTLNATVPLHGQGESAEHRDAVRKRLSRARSSLIVRHGRPVEELCSSISARVCDPPSPSKSVLRWTPLGKGLLRHTWRILTA
jgi:hypothetical protein